MAKNWAIAIGINQYEFLQPLRYAKRDAELMRQFLEQDAGFDRVFFFSDDSPPVNGKSTRPFGSNILRVLRQVFETPFMGDGDNFWFFFSGHGIRHNERDYLMPLDGDPEAVERTGISTHYITERLRRCGADNVVMMLDACRSEGRRSGIGLGQQTEEEARQTGVISIFSCSPEQYSYEIEAIQQGAFTCALLEGLGIRGRCSTVERLNQYLERRVPEIVGQHLSRVRQVPYSIAEPISRSHLILMPQYASLSDIASLKIDAARAERRRNYDLAQRLWIRVLAAASGQDMDAIEALQHIALRRATLAPPDPKPVPPPNSDTPPPQQQPRPSPSPPKPKPTQPQSSKLPSPPRPTPPSPSRPATSQQPRQPSFLPINRRRFLQIAGGVGASMGAITLGRVFWPDSDSQTAESEDSATAEQVQAQTTEIPGFEPEAKTDTAVEFSVVSVTPTGDIDTVERQSANYRTEDLGGGVLLDLIAIPEGTFTMGSPNGSNDEPAEAGRADDEGPQRPVSVSAFEMGKYPVTQAQWQAVAVLQRVNRDLESNPSYFEGGDRPVENVSWHDAVEFCDRLSQHTGRTYRLPSEAEWEYACRAGTTTPFYFGETITTQLANYNGNSTYGAGPEGVYRQETTDVGIFPANGFGLYDMHGNVWEWCLDHWHDSYEGAPPDGQAWIEGGNSDLRLLRGGSWFNYPRYCRSANRNRINAGDRNGNIGFRVVSSPPRALP